MAKTKNTVLEEKPKKSSQIADIEIMDLSKFAEQSYLNYSMYVILDRALPHVEDGLKPVQRRIVYAMNELSLSHTAKTKKSARTVGDVIGKYHPHGDCLDGETLVYTLDGAFYKLKDLIGKEFIWVFAWDEKNRKYVPAKAHSFRVGQITKETYKINLSDGSYLEATGNHPFFVQDLGWVKTENLRDGMSLLGGKLLLKNTTGYSNFSALNHDDLNLIPASYDIFITSIEIISYQQEKEMYDFTVDNFENMLIASKVENGDVTLVVAHNSSVYEAMVTMEQPFSYRYPLVDGQGNWGSQDDPKSFAAMRYCFKGDTLINTNFGLIRMDEIPELFGHSKKLLKQKNARIKINLNIVGIDGKAKATKWINSGQQDMLKIKTSNDFETSCTPNEPFYVLTNSGHEWVTAENLKIGDIVCSSRQPLEVNIEQKFNFLGKKGKHKDIVTLEKMSNSLARFLGYMVAEGSATENKINFCNTDLSVVEDYMNVLQENFPNVSCNIRDRKSSGYGKLPYKSIDSCGTNFVNFLNYIDMPRKTAAFKYIPSTILKANKEQVKNFISGFFEGGGCISKKKNGEFSIAIGSASKLLLKQLKLLLWVHFQIVTGNIVKDRKCFKLNVIGAANICKFIKEINFTSIRKKELAEQALEYYSNIAKTAGNSKTDQIPWQVLSDILGNIRLHKTTKSFREHYKNGTYSYKFVTLEQQKLLDEIYNKNYFYHQVSEICVDEKNWVYDLTVPKDHSFSANGLLVHNTESKLTPYSSTLLAELDQGTVNWKQNFDGTMKEPKLLPARLPNILLNGGTGIAVGMATDIPPHNIKEVVEACQLLLKSPKSTLEDIMGFVQAPDFPTGCEIINSKKEIINIYETGNGSIKLRAKWKEEDGNFVITHVPHQVSPTKIMEQIAEQMRNKKLPLVEDLRDESDHAQPVRIVIIPRSNRIDGAALMSHLFATTDLEKNVRVNLNMIGLDGKPQVKGLVTILKEWLTFRVSTVKKRFENRLEQINDRLHILEGLLIAYLNLDKVIKIIREDEDPKASLIKQFSLSEIQANAILELRLRHLMRLEEMKLKSERSELEIEKKKIEDILASETKLKRVVSKELEDDSKNFGDARLSTVIEREASQAIDLNELTPAEPVTVVLSKAGWIRAAKGHGIDLGALAYKAGDVLLASSEGKTNQSLVLFDSAGRAYTLSPKDLPSIRTQGEPITTKLDLQPGATVYDMLIGNNENHYVVGNKGGYGFVVKLEDLQARNRAGKIILTGTGPYFNAVLSQDINTEYLAVVGSGGHLLVFPLKDLPVLPKGKGNKLINLKKDESVIAVAILNAQSSLLVDSLGRTMTLKPNDWQRYLGARASRGSLLPKGYNKVSNIKIAS